MNLESYIDYFKQLGIWLGRAVPKVGDIVVFQGNQYRGLGLVKEFEGRMVVLVEDVKDGREDLWNWSDGRIEGYARVGV